MIVKTLYEGPFYDLHREHLPDQGWSLSEKMPTFLKAEAEAARSKSYAPYSHFNVGAAGLFLKAGQSGQSTKIFTGANQENAAHTPTACAERVAIAQARHAGYHTLLAMGVSGGLDSSYDQLVRQVADGQWVAPCGVCRQVMNEIAHDDALVFLFRGDDHVMVVRFTDLFPLAFGPKNLGIIPSSYQP